MERRIPVRTENVPVVRHESLCKSGPWKHVVHCVRVAHGNM